MSNDRERSHQFSTGETHGRLSPSDSNRQFRHTLLVVEVDEPPAARRADAGWIQHLTSDYAEALHLLDRATMPAAIGLIGNIAEIAPRLVADGVRFDIATDQTAVHDCGRGKYRR